MKYRFPNIDVVQRQLLTCVYQEEEFQYLNGLDYIRIESLLKKSTDDQFVLREIKNYNNQGYLVSQEIVNNENTKRELRAFNYEDKKIFSEYEDQIIEWRFNSDGYLIKEDHKFKFDGPTVYNFELDEKGDLIKINDVQFVKTNGITSSIISSETIGDLFENIQFKEQENLIELGIGSHKNILQLDELGRVIKRTNNYRIVETEYSDNNNWNSFLTLEGKTRKLNYTKTTEIEDQKITTIETKHMESGEIEYEFKEIHYQR